MKTTITKNIKNKNFSKHNIIATNNTPQAKSYNHQEPQEDGQKKKKKKKSATKVFI